MKVLSIIEPWGSLIANGKKKIETRSWKTNYRGEIYIHASSKKLNFEKTLKPEVLELIQDMPMNYGNIICKCNLVDCVYMDDAFLEEIKKNSQEYVCGEYSKGRYAWILQDTKMLETPIPTKGKLNIWEY